jgi:hypothetical protein
MWSWPEGLKRALWPMLGSLATVASGMMDMRSVGEELRLAELERKPWTDG